MCISVLMVLLTIHVVVFFKILTNIPVWYKHVQNDVKSLTDIDTIGGGLFLYTRTFCVNHKTSLNCQEDLDGVFLNCSLDSAGIYTQTYIATADLPNDFIYLTGTIGWNASSTIFACSLL